MPTQRRCLSFTGFLLISLIGSLPFAWCGKKIETEIYDDEQSPGYVINLYPEDATQDLEWDEHVQKVSYLRIEGFSLESLNKVLETLSPHPSLEHIKCNACDLEAVPDVLRLPARKDKFPKLRIITLKQNRFRSLEPDLFDDEIEVRMSRNPLLYFHPFFREQERFSFQKTPVAGFFDLIDDVNKTPQSFCKKQEEILSTIWRIQDEMEKLNSKEDQKEMQKIFSTLANKVESAKEVRELGSYMETLLQHYKWPILWSQETQELRWQKEEIS